MLKCHAATAGRHFSASHYVRRLLSWLAAALMSAAEQPLFIVCFAGIMAAIGCVYVVTPAHYAAA